MSESDGACPRLSANGRQSGINVVRWTDPPSRPTDKPRLNPGEAAVLEALASRVADAAVRVAEEDDLLKDLDVGPFITGVLIPVPIVSFSLTRYKAFFLQGCWGHGRGGRPFGRRPFTKPPVFNAFHCFSMPSIAFHRLSMPFIEFSASHYCLLPTVSAATASPPPPSPSPPRRCQASSRTR
jgi:hypothetical protein